MRGVLRRGPWIDDSLLRADNFLVRVRAIRRGYKGVRWKKYRFACLLGEQSWLALWKIPVMRVVPRSYMHA